MIGGEVGKVREGSPTFGSHLRQLGGSLTPSLVRLYNFWTKAAGVKVLRFPVDGGPSLTIASRPHIPSLTVNTFAFILNLTSSLPSPFAHNLVLAYTNF